MEREKKLYATLFLTSLLSGLPHSNSAKNFRRDGKYGVNYAHFVKNPFQRLNSAVLDSLIVSRTLECTYRCVNHQECYSVNYGIASLTCELLNANKFQNWTDVVHSEIWDHYNIKVSRNLFPFVAEICFYFHILRNESLCVLANGGKPTTLVLFWKGSGCDEG